MKRKQADHHHLKYVVMETKFVSGTFVEFMPQIWVIPPRNKKLAHEERSVVKFLFPRRLPNQSKDAYTRYVKQAKFNCTPTERNEKWELRDGRILKMGIDSLEEALDAEKFYSDYFSTAEDEIQEPSAAPSAKKTFSKKKKVEKDKPMDDSESDEGEHEQNAQPISNYNICFQADDQFLNQFITLDGDSDILGEFSQVMDDGSLELRSPVQAAQISQGTVFGEGNAPRVSDDLQIIGSTVFAGGNLLNLSNEKFASIELPTAAISESEDALDDDRYNDQQIDTIDQQQARCSSSGSCCKSHQKVLNKIDYLQKKVVQGNECVAPGKQFEPTTFVTGDKLTTSNSRTD
ncbi:uncharacterized protein LOC119075964 [Bradysia coprophila]|uniref:uncharacterized protein LOC119075964 n=1 Tax=Bradysia coprophila TaxID=38358 RepID=UPI00187DCCBB|nr:uncharacterized protein LOC119075964 [Bradysia coprophila]